MASVEAVVSALVHSHDELERLMADASAASVDLSANPANSNATRQWASGLVFVRSAVAHMHEEEAGAFAAAEDAGVSDLQLQLLRIEHARLRMLAAELLQHDGPDDEGALLLLRFLHRFERHVEHEEWTLAKSART